MTLCDIPYTLKVLRWINFHIFCKLVCISENKIKTVKLYC